MEPKVGYPTFSPNVTSPEALQAYYSDLPIHINSSSHLFNALSFNNRAVRRDWAQLSHPTDPNIWFMTATIVNAYYNPYENTITFSSGRSAEASPLPPFRTFLRLLWGLRLYS